ncbi:hypothetical protein MWLf4_0016 [Limosilactobacillus fermentum]|nr:hypothetical protein MWLf4_0016 [Limosilactobacillus fermentum]
MTIVLASPFLKKIGGQGKWAPPPIEDGHFYTKKPPPKR